MLTVENILGPKGRIAARLEGYESRPEQLEMAAAVGDAIANQRHLIVEAGTGVGKSFAYLVPAILAVTEAEDPDELDPPKRPPKRIVISTHTISLQEQLLEKDLPLLSSIIPREFSSVLAKGRRNYVSLRRLQAAQARSASLFTHEDAFDQLRQLASWSKKTNDGSLSDLAFRPLGPLWDEVASESGNCLGRKCPTYGDCFYFRARRRLNHAQILVVNHALFFSDLALRRDGANILPDYDVAVLDEAHTLESVAGDHLGLSVTSGQIEYLLSRLYNDRTNRGLLVHHQLGGAQQEVERCRVRAAEFFDDVLLWQEDRGPANGRVHQPDIVPNLLSPALLRLADRIKRHGDDQKDEAEKQDFISAFTRLEVLASMIGRWVSQRIENAVYWVETSTTHRGRQRRLSLNAVEVDIGPAMRKHLFDQVPSVIMTSATLATGSGSFQFFKSRIGLTKSDELKLGSPFDFQKQARLVLLDDMPDPSKDSARYERKVHEMIRRYVLKSEGRAFVLFTSYAMMRGAAAALGPWMTRHNLHLLCQSDGLPRSKMIRQFKESPRCVLFGADSFWQGVDIPGEALQNVIITRLPFGVPDRPLTEARLEAIRQEGRNPFREFSLPAAAIKLKQGFGRLIRNRLDHGIVVILDPRVCTKSYGKVLLASLPKCEVIVESAEEGLASRGGNPESRNFFNHESDE